MPSNDALQLNPFVVNGQPVAYHITTHGSDWYWAVMSIMGVTTVATLGLGFLKPRTDRIFHFLLAATALVATVEHYSMAANLGWVPIGVEWNRGTGDTRQIWWVRYCAWFITWPLLSTVVSLTAGMPAVSVIWTAFLAAVMPILAVVGALVSSIYKWGYFAFWGATLVGLGYYLIYTPMRYARELGSDIKTAHRLTSGWVILLWALYPICWGLSEGGNVLHPDSEFIFYGILDVCLIPGTAALVLWTHRRIAPQRLGMEMRDHDGLFKMQKAAFNGNGNGNGHGHGVNGAGAHTHEERKEEEKEAAV